MERRPRPNRIQIGKAELTEPYEHLLATSLVADITSEIALIRSATSANAEGGPYEPPSDARCSIFVKLAERSGRRANPGALLEGLVEALMEPVGREARRRAVHALRPA